MNALFRARSVVMVGATERSIWSNSAYGNLKRFEYGGGLHLVNRKGGTVYGRPAATSCAAIGEQIDLALLMVPEKGIIDVLPDLEASGVRAAVILSSGFAETGHAGLTRQASLAEAAAARGIRILGPNCLGFINYTDRLPVWTTPMRRPRWKPTIALGSQSGATGNHLGNTAHHLGIGLSMMISTGNEADVDISDVLEFLVDDPMSRAIALFVEAVRDPAKFKSASRRALDAGKPVVVLKVGRSAIAARAAQAHTGSLVGDDRIFDAVCRDLGITRVDSAEDLIITADMMARLGPIERPGLGFISMSGGVCEIAADRAEMEGLTLPAFAADTLAALEVALPDFGTPNNPLDVTGEAMLRPELYEQAARIVADDPNIGVVAAVFDAPERFEGAEFAVQMTRNIGSGFAGGSARGVQLATTLLPVSTIGRQAADDNGVDYSGGGVHHGLRAIAAAINYVPNRRSALRERPTALHAIDRLPNTERDALALLRACGVPAIAAELCRTRAEAIDAANALGEPMALKISSPDIQHKSEVGGVRLDLFGNEAVGNAFDRMMADVSAACPGATIEGAIVAPMRRGGLELFVGVVRDPAWGAAISLGLGGVWIEALGDVATRLLPICEDDALDMLGELKASKLLDGYRGTPAVNRRAVAAAAVAIGNVALSLGDRIDALEINPLLAFDGKVEALDALIVSSDPAGAARPGGH